MSEALAKTVSNNLSSLEKGGACLRSQVVKVASMHSFLENLGIDASDMREHLYDLLAIWSRKTRYTYIPGLVELSTYKKREISHLVDLYGEKGLEVILALLEDEACKMEKEEERLKSLIEDLEVGTEASRRIIELAKSKGCWGLRSASIALLITPRRDEK